MTGSALGLRRRASQAARQAKKRATASSAERMVWAVISDEFAAPDAAVAFCENAVPDDVG